jgi:ligand-binding SRPBCC domain-containing protein
MRIERALERFAWAPRAGARPSRGISVLHEETIVPASLDETFAFFSDAANLERLTPPWLNFRIRTPQPIAMAEGTEIEYRIVLYGIPIPWLTRIDVWEPGVRFVDRQLRGPYRWWHHEHRFEAVDGGTRVIDHVEFVPRARIVSGPMVRRDVRRIFDYRKGELARLFTQPRDQGRE